VSKQKNDPGAHKPSGSPSYAPSKPSKKRSRSSISRDSLVGVNDPDRQIEIFPVADAPDSFKFSRRLLRRKHVSKEVKRMKQKNALNQAALIKPQIAQLDMQTRIKSGTRTLNFLHI